MFNDVERLPRSYSKSEHWTPDWRNRQAMAYLASFRGRLALEADDGSQEEAALALLGKVRFPVWEDDKIVKARFMHAAGSPCLTPNWVTAFDISDEQLE